MKNRVASFVILIALAMVAFMGCMESRKSNTDTPGEGFAISSEANKS
jgi:hypothetical protein